jgi:hypothetical protein
MPVNLGERVIILPRLEHWGSGYGNCPSLGMGMTGDGNLTILA